MKALISGSIIALASEPARNNTTLGALLTALPLVTVLAMIWLWLDTGDAAGVSSYARTTFWLVLPAPPSYLVLPRLLSQGRRFPVVARALGRDDGRPYLIVLRVLPMFGISI